MASLHRTVGNKAVQEAHENGDLQAKLEISQTDDKYEREAERVAEEVLRMPEPESTVDADDSSQSTPAVRYPDDSSARKADRTAKTVMDTSTSVTSISVYRRRLSSRSREVSPAVERELRTSSSGRRLPETVRSFFEPRFGADLTGIRIHTDSEASELCRGFNASAFAYGQDIYFKKGKYKPNTEPGKKLLAHELTHVLQQTGHRHSQQISEKRTQGGSQRGLDIGNSPFVIARNGPSSSTGQIGDIGDVFSQVSKDLKRQGMANTYSEIVSDYYERWNEIRRNQRKGLHQVVTFIIYKYKQFLLRRYLLPSGTPAPRYMGMAISTGFTKAEAERQASQVLGGFPRPPEPKEPHGFDFGLGYQAKWRPWPVDIYISPDGLATPRPPSPVSPPSGI